MDWVVLITALVALYGAALSTYTLISSRLDKRRRIKVELSKGFLPTDVDPPKTMLFIQVSNPGHITVTIQPPGIQLPGGGTRVFRNPNSDVGFPHDLDPGKACTVWTPLAVLAKQFKEKGFSGKVELVGFCRDAVGTTHKGKRWEFNVDTQSD